MKSFLLIITIFPSSLFCIASLDKYSLSSSLQFGLMNESLFNEHFQSSADLYKTDYNFIEKEIALQKFFWGIQLNFQYQFNYQQFFSVETNFLSDIAGHFSVVSQDNKETFTNSLGLYYYCISFLTGYYIFKKENFYFFVEAGLLFSVNELLFEENLDSTIFNNSNNNKNSLLSFGGGLSASLNFILRIQNTNGILIKMNTGFIYISNFFGSNSFDDDILLVKGPLSQTQKKEVLLLTTKENFNPNTQQEVNILQPFFGFSIGFWQSL